MTAGTPGRDALLAMWDGLAGVTSGERLFRTRRLPHPQALHLRVGLREPDAAPCLIAVADGMDTSMVVAFDTGGLRLQRVRDGAGLLVVLSLEEPGRRDLFAEVCSDLLRSVDRSGAAAPEQAIGDMAERLDAWRAFLRDRSSVLQEHEALGIAGELVVLRRLLEIEADALAAWRSPDDGLHDFRRGGRALEVKSALGPASRMRISTLDQLDDAGLIELSLAHVRFAEAPDGENVFALAARTEAALPGGRRREFRNALLRRGLPPDVDGTMPPLLRLVAVDFYLVSSGFPRLRRCDVPVGIVEGTYDLDVRGLADHATSGSGILAAIAGGRDD